jgi:hypothetical protein
MNDQLWYDTYEGYRDPDRDRAVLKDSMSRQRTNIFCEFNTSRHEDYPPLYTMREQEWKGLPSAYRIYMASHTEYEAAMKLVGSWNHWQRLLKISKFVNGSTDTTNWSGLHQWREEKEIREKARAYVQLKMNAMEGNVQAQKILFDGLDKKRGRPSAAEVKKSAEQMAKDTKDLKDDLKRVRLAVSNGQAA